MAAKTSSVTQICAGYYFRNETEFHRTLTVLDAFFSEFPSGSSRSWLEPIVIHSLRGKPLPKHSAIFDPKKGSPVFPDPEEEVAPDREDLHLTAYATVLYQTLQTFAEQWTWVHQTLTELIEQYETETGAIQALTRVMFTAREVLIDFSGDFELHYPLGDSVPGILYQGIQSILNGEWKLSVDRWHLEAVDASMTEEPERYSATLEKLSRQSSGDDSDHLIHVLLESRAILSSISSPGYLLVLPIAYDSYFDFDQGEPMPVLTEHAEGVLIVAGWWQTSTQAYLMRDPATGEFQKDPIFVSEDEQRKLNPWLVSRGAPEAMRRHLLLYSGFKPNTIPLDDRNRPAHFTDDAEVNTLIEQLKEAVTAHFGKAPGFRFEDAFAEILMYEDYADLQRNAQPGREPHFSKLSRDDYNVLARNFAGRLTLCSYKAKKSDKAIQTLQTTLLRIFLEFSGTCPVQPKDVLH